MTRERLVRTTLYRFWLVSFAVIFEEFALACTAVHNFGFSPTNVLALFRLLPELVCICSPCAILNHGPMHISIVISLGSSLASVKTCGIQPCAQGACQGLATPT